MKGPFRTCLVLTALLAPIATAQQLTAGDLYNKEPAHTEATVGLLPSATVAPEATRQALVGLPLALVWQLERVEQ